jgi:hypothetical protein
VSLKIFEITKQKINLLTSKTCLTTTSGCPNRSGDVAAVADTGARVVRSSLPGATFFLRKPLQIINEITKIEKIE